MLLKKMIFVFNPTAGKSEIPYHIYEILNIFTQEGYLVTIYPTQNIKDGYEKIKKYGSEYDIVVCAGGDGTLNEAVSAMMLLDKKPKLGYIPSGTVNDFAKSVGIPIDFFHAATTITQGDLFNFDVGQLNDKYFCYVAGFGAFTSVSYDTPQKWKNILGDMGYLLKGISEVANIKSYDCQVSVDGEVFEDRYMLGLISSSSSVAGIKGLTGQNAKMDDGIFEITLVKTPKNIIELQEILASFIARDLKGEMITSASGGKITIRCDDDIDWVIDGEFGGTFKESVIYNHEKALEIYVASEDLNKNLILK